MHRTLIAIYTYTPQTNPPTPQSIHSGDYVSNANEQVVTAIEHAKRSRKYTCCMLLFVMAIVVAAVLVLFKFKLIKI